ncbi:isorenieratene synthase [Pseudonocardia sediminis]|uniref:Isorenieratene synthase n=1 Tax=Pseudonocardia sediminis TaxID=1397368 RepID=A0A4Q7UVI2_PSEST|nr:FAD-dependent oxidoreductase [Pseudonocardia sediminis]RZT84948.1 isorenieratene synthase [Pseudonocardia sediminis]
MIDELRGRAAPLRMRPRRLVTADPTLPHRAPEGTEAVVVGAGVAGVSAALVLAERGVRVRLVEAADTLGGRLGAWPHTLPDGTEQVVEHGFHAFFRHYYTWRSILRRIDPELGFLAPVEGYPVISRRWAPEDLGSLPAAPPLNLFALFARSASLRLSDVSATDPELGQALLAYDRTDTTERFDAMSAGEFLRGLGMSERANSMLFEAFARSFFCDEESLSAAELLAMFHYYFLGNPEGIAFDAPMTDHRTCIWDPLWHRLTALGASVETGSPVRCLTPEGDGWRLDVGGSRIRTRHVVLALDPGALRTLLAASPAAAAAAPRFATQCSDLAVAPPFTVSRLWLDRDVDASRATFSAVSGEAQLDSVAVYSRLEEPSARWARRTGGSIVELHSYACRAPDAATSTARMRAELAVLWPETAAARVVHVHERREATAPSFPPGGAGRRPGVRTDARGVRVAGDFVDLPYVAGLMERASMSGVLAANDVLAEVGAGPEEITGVPQRGLLAGLRGPSRGTLSRGTLSRAGR